jgi:hypothetical protein
MAWCYAVETRLGSVQVGRPGCKTVLFPDRGAVQRWARDAGMIVFWNRSEVTA